MFFLWNLFEITRNGIQINPASDGENQKTISTISAKVTPWMEKTLQGFANGLRRPESERIFAWCNYVTAGVLSAGKTEFTVNTITQLAHSNPRNFIAVVLLPNRSGDLRAPTTKHLFQIIVSLSLPSVLFLFLVFSNRFNHAPT